MSSAGALRFFAVQVCQRAQLHMPLALRQQWRAASSPAALRRACAGPHLGNALGGRPSLPAAQRQQQRRLAVAAAAAGTTAAEPAVLPAPTSAQRKELPKNFDPAASEEALYQWWESSGYFRPDMAATGEPYTLSMPPPNVTGKLHMGHAMFATLQVGGGCVGGLERPCVPCCRWVGVPLWVDGMCRQGQRCEQPSQHMQAARRDASTSSRCRERCCGRPAHLMLWYPRCRTLWRGISACGGGPRCGCQALVRRTTSGTIAGWSLWGVLLPP